ncbi:MAG: hypothetical protein ACO1RA_20915 [Planctomycetaceae bacterium]
MDFITPPTDTLYKFIAISGAAIIIAANIWSYRATTALEQTEAELDKTYIQVEVRIDALISSAMCFHDVRKLNDKISTQADEIGRLEKIRVQKKEKYSEQQLKLESEVAILLDELLHTLSYAPTVERFQANAKNQGVEECWQSCCNKDPESYKVFVETITPTTLNNQYAPLRAEARALRIEAAKGGSEFLSLALAYNRQIDFNYRCWQAGWIGVVLAGGGLVAWYFQAQRHQDSLLFAQLEKAKAEVNKAK